MRQAIGLTAGVAMVVGAGLVHGIWTQRWSKSADLATAVARMEGLPESLGPWKGERDAEDRDAMKAAGAQGWWVRRYVNQRNGDSVLVLLLCGPSARMCVHRPEHCYTGAGFELTIPPEPFHLQESGHPGAQMYTARFRKPQVGGGVSLRIFWSWLAGDRWRAPDNPRWELSSEPYLYKLYVIHEVPDVPGRPQDDPSVGLMQLLVPALSQSLVASPQVP